MPHYLPTPKTIASKVSGAITAMDAGKYAYVASKHVVGDMEELGLDTVDDYWDAIFGFLHEIREADPVKCYVGGRPPQRCYETGFKKMELYAYAWESASAGCRMYLKFGMRDDTYYHLDCHEDRIKS